VKLITPEVKRANPSLFAAACKKHFFGTWKKALRAALRTEKENLQVEPVASVTEVAPDAKAVVTQLAGFSA